MAYDTQKNVLMQDAAAAQGNGNDLNVSGLGVAGVQIAGTFVGTVTFEGSVDGTNWQAIQAINKGTAAAATTATAAGLYVLNVAGLHRLRARISAYTSGAITVVGFATTGEQPLAGSGTSGGLTDAELRATAVPTSVGAITLPSAIFAGQKTIAAAGTQEALASSQALLSGVRIKALAANTNNVYVGDSDVSSTTGFVLDAGEEVFIEVDNLATVYIDVDTNGEGATYVAS